MGLNIKIGIFCANIILSRTRNSSFQILNKKYLYVSAKMPAFNAIQVIRLIMALEFVIECGSFDRANEGELTKSPTNLYANDSNE